MIGENCKVVLGSVCDERREPSVVGDLDGVAVKSAPDLKAWVASAFQTLACPKKAVLPAASNDATRLTLQINLVKAWVGCVGPTVSTSLLVRVRYLRSNIVVKDALYRGGDTSADLIRTQAYIQSDFDAAMRQVLREVDEDLANDVSLVSTYKLNS